jgi:hypothetical protein
MHFNFFSNCFFGEGEGHVKMQNENEHVKCPMVVQTDSPERAKWKEENESEELEEDEEVQAMLYDCVQEEDTFNSQFPNALLDTWTGSNGTLSCSCSYTSAFDVS